MSKLNETNPASTKPEEKGTQVFVGGVAHTTTESKIREVFSSCGEIVEIQLIKDQKGNPKGFCFVRFATKNAADKAVKEKTGYVLDGKKIRVLPSVAHDTLFLGNLNKGWSAKEFDDIVRQVFPDVASVDLAIAGEAQPGQKQQNRGFAFVKFSSHAAAARAFRLGSQSNFLIDGKLHPSVQWAEEEREVDPDELAQIKVAFVRNLPTGADEDYLKKLFQPFGNVEKVAVSNKGGSIFGFVYFEKRSDLDNAIKVLNEKTVQGLTGGPSCKLQVELAKPKDKNKKRAREDSKNISSGKIEIRAKLLKDGHVKTAGALKSFAQREMDYSDPYEAVVVALPAVVKERLLRILRLGIATRYDINVEILSSLKMLPELAAISVLDQFMLSGADMQDKGGYLASLISKQVDKLGLRQFASMSRIEDVALRVPEADSFSGRTHLPILDSYASREPLHVPRTDLYAKYSSYLDPHLSGFGTTKRMEEESPILSSRVSARRLEEASPILHTTSLLSSRFARLEEESPTFQIRRSPSATNERVGIHSHITATSDHQHSRPQIRFDPFTGEPYKFDPFTGEPIVPESSSRYRSLY